MPWKAGPGSKLRRRQIRRFLEKMKTASFVQRHFIRLLFIQFEQPRLFGGEVAVQTDRVLKNLSAILKAAGSGLEKVVRSTVFLKNMSDFTAMNEVYGRYFNAAPPARSTVEVARLPKDVLVEIDVIALA